MLIECAPEMFESLSNTMKTDPSVNENDDDNELKTGFQLVMRACQRFYQSKTYVRTKSTSQRRASIPTNCLSLFDADVLLEETLPLNEEIDPEHKPSCIHMIITEPNIRIKLTSGYIRGINLSKLIRIYTKFDSRVIQLLRLFRILAKVC